VLIHASHTAKEVSEAVSRAWPDLYFLLYRPEQGGSEESLLAPNEKLSDASSASIALEGAMTGREASEALRRAFGVLVEISVESGKSVMNTALDKAR
jgi:hypothetical protein